MFFWSNQIYCNRCGGTNRYFYKRKSSDRKSGWKIEKRCKECINELQRINKTLKGYWKTEKFKEHRRQYSKVNLQNILKLNREYKQRQKVKRMRQDKKDPKLMELSYAENYNH